MIISEIFTIHHNKNLTKKYIEDFFKRKNIISVKWAISEFSEDNAKILVSFEKKK